MRLEKSSGSVIIAWNFEEGTDGVVIFGKKNKSGIPDILNAFEGPEAAEIRDKVFEWVEENE